MTLTIQKARRGTWGTGWEVYAGSLPRRTYLGYSVREAERLYREAYGLKGKHLDRFILD